MLVSFFRAHGTQSPMSQATTPNPEDHPPSPHSADNPGQGSPPPDDTARDSSPSTPSATIQRPTLHAATNDYRGGHRSFLDVIFDARLGYDEVRASILQHLNTIDFDNLRQVSSSIDHCLRMPSAAGGLRYPPDLVDKCHETGLPIPPSLAPRGSCPNPPQSTVRIRTCQFHKHPVLNNRKRGQNIAPHGEDYLVCEVCRRNWHNNIGTNPINGIQNPMTRHDYWRVLIAGAHITLCSLCDQEQKQQYSPQGHDGCVCYHEYYKKWWLCQRCDILNGNHKTYIIGVKTAGKRHLKQLRNRIVMLPSAQGPEELPEFLSWCPCGRRVTEPSPPRIQTVPTPWPGNHHLIPPVLNHDTGLRRQTTKQCVECCGYIVPPVPGAAPRQPIRRSARLADRRSGKQKERRHTMLGRNGKTATRHGVNSKGFEVRGRGGWN